MMGTREEKEARVVRPHHIRLCEVSASVRPSPSPAPCLPSSQLPSVASPWVLPHPLVGFLYLCTQWLTVPTITPLNEPSVSCQDPS